MAAVRHRAARGRAESSEWAQLLLLLLLPQRPALPPHLVHHKRVEVPAALLPGLDALDGAALRGKHQRSGLVHGAHAAGCGLEGRWWRAARREVDVNRRHFLGGAAQRP